MSGDDWVLAGGCGEGHIQYSHNYSIIIHWIQWRWTHCNKIYICWYNRHYICTVWWERWRGHPHPSGHMSAMYNEVDILFSYKISETITIKIGKVCLLLSSCEPFCRGKKCWYFSGVHFGENVNRKWYVCSHKNKMFKWHSFDIWIWVAQFCLMKELLPSPQVWSHRSISTNKQTLLFQITNMRMCAGRHASWCWDCWCLTGTFFIMVMLRSVGECPSRHCKGRHTTTHPCHNRMGANIFANFLSEIMQTTYACAMAE